METLLLTESELDIVFDRARNIVESMSHVEEVMQVLVPWRPKNLYVWVELRKVEGTFQRVGVIETLKSG